MHRVQTVIALQKQLNLLDNVPIGECVLRRDGTVLFWNTCLENWTTLSRAQIIGRKIDLYFPHLNQLRYTRRLQETFDGGFTVIFSSQIHPHLIPCYCARGQLRVQHTIVTPIPAANGIGFDALFSIQDVTDLTQSIHQSELLQRVHHRNINLERQVHARTLELQQALTLESTLKRITDKVRDSLDEDQILQSVVTELGEALEVYHCDTTLYSSSQGTFSIQQQYTHPDARSMESHDYHHHLHVEELFEIYDQLFRGQHFAFCQLRWHASNHHAAVLACPVLDDQGVLGDLWLFKASASSFSDLEIRLVQQVANQCAIGIRQAQLYKASQQKIEELAHLNHLKDHFLSTISHELRTPLVSIRMALQTLEVLLNRSDNVQNNAQGHTQNNTQNRLTQAGQYFQLLEDECQRETKLIDDLLNLTRLEVGAEPIVCVPIHLESWLPYIAEGFEGRMQQRRQSLNLEITKELPPLITDITILERILTELLNNAYKYTPAGETIIVSAQLMPLELSQKTTRQDTRIFKISRATSQIASRFSTSDSSHLPQIQRNSIHISVSNSGAEIAQAELNRIFDKFYRIPNVDPWCHGGTGLGLALAKQMVEYLGGSIQVESKNNVTQFTLDLAIDP